ncbi:MAG: leucine-rich repeat protein [Oscillospiraceae bacterium]|nr:leucine-rich repeat protein [Oscillospiraceae bacterium]
MKIKNIIAAAISLCAFGNMISYYKPVSHDFHDFAITANASSYKGNFGENLFWGFDDFTETLTIYGEGEMYSDYLQMSDWYYYCEYADLKQKIKKISFLGTPTNIVRDVFSGMTSLESVSFHSGIERIESGAFENCTALTSVNLAGVNSVDGFAFSGCAALTEVTVSNPKCTLGNNAFPKTTIIKGYPYSTAQKFAELYNYQFEELKDETPPGVGIVWTSCNSNEIYMHASVYDNQTLVDHVWLEFCIDDSEDWIEVELEKYKDTTITSVADGGSYTGSASYTLAGVSSASTVHYRIKVMDIVGNVETGINHDMTLKPVYLDSLTDIVTQDGITYLLFDDHAEVYKCDLNLRGEVVIPQKISGLPVTKVCGFAFKYCEKITEVILPDCITEIRREAFYGCTSLQSVFLPESIIKIEDSIFRECSSLKEITIPKKVDEISLVLHECTDLTDVYILNPDCRFSNSDINNGKNEDEYIFNGTIHGYKGSAAQTSAEKYNYHFEAIPVTKITLTVGEQYAIDTEDIEGNDFTYQSSDSTVAIVSKSGVVTALSEGQSKIFIINEENDALVLTVNVINEITEGDINGDGAFNVADAVLLQKWLLAVPNTKLANWEAADLYRDGKLNIFDLVMMKKELLK